MHAKEHAETVVDLTPDLPLADVIQMPQIGQASFYTRNSAALPRLNIAASAQYGRVSLPTPVEAAPNTILNRLKEFASKNRPAWWPQR